MTGLLRSIKIRNQAKSSKLDHWNIFPLFDQWPSIGCLLWNVLFIASQWVKDSCDTAATFFTSVRLKDDAVTLTLNYLQSFQGIIVPALVISCRMGELISARFCWEDGATHTGSDARWPKSKRLWKNLPFSSIFTTSAPPCNVLGRPCVQGTLGIRLTLVNKLAHSPRPSRLLCFPGSPAHLATERSTKVSRRTGTRALHSV